jgi:hypothetical protein
MNIDEFRAAVRESLYGPATDATPLVQMGSTGSVTEKLDPHVDELAGSLIAAGPQKTADAIGKMDPATFTEFAKKIDAKGILMITKQFTAGGGEEAPGAPEQAAAAPGVDTNNPTSGDLGQELKDL